MLLHSTAHVFAVQEVNPWKNLAKAYLRSGLQGKKLVIDILPGETQSHIRRVWPSFGADSLHGTVVGTPTNPSQTLSLD